MSFHLFHDGQQRGPFSIEEVRSQLNAGLVRPTDLFWQEGTPDWRPLSALPGLPGGSPPIPPPLPSSRHPAAPTPTSGLAISSLVLGIVSFMSLGLTSIPAVICGHLATSQIKKSAGRLTGHGLAVAGLVTGYIGLFFFFLGFLGILAGIALPVFNAVQERGQATKAMAEAKQIVLGCKIYAGDHGGKFPDTLDQLVPEYLSDRHLFVCPLTKNDPMGYTYYGGTDADPADKILLTSKGTTRRHERIVVHVDDSAALQRE